MRVTLDLPEELARYLGETRKSSRGLRSRHWRFEGIRLGRISIAQGRRVLGIDTRDQMDAFLKAHHVEIPLTIEQVRRDTETALALSN